MADGAEGTRSDVRYNPAAVRFVDRQKQHRTLSKADWASGLAALDIWSLRSFRGQSPRQAAWNAATRLLPCLLWLAKYDWRKQLAGDVGAGVAVTFLIVPQGLSYAGVAGLPAIYGLYTDFVPLFFYFLYGTSKYLQVGAVAIVSLLTANTISALLQPETAALAVLNGAAKAAAAALKAQPGNSTLAGANALASAAYTTASAELIQRQVATASLLAFYVGIFSFGIGILKLGKIMNLMGPAVISGFQTAAAITIALGQFKNLFGYGKDFTTGTTINVLIKSYIDHNGDLNYTTIWSGWLWIALLLLFKNLSRVTCVRIRGYPVLKFLKISGPVIVCITAIVSTKLAELHLSPGCTGYDQVKNVANVYVASSSADVWNISYTAITTTNFLGELVTYTPPRDNPHCVPMPKSNVAGAVVPYPWPRQRGIAITGPFGQPPSGGTPKYSLVSGELLTGAIVITLVASLESVAIAKALASKHKQPDLNPSAEYIALGIANFVGSFTHTFPISGSFSRSALNDEVGASSPIAVLVVAVLVGIVLKIASVAPIFFYLPQNVLSAIVVVALINLLDFDHLAWLMQYDRKDALLWLTAFIAVLFQGVEIGILIAVVVSLGLVVLETLLAPVPQLGLVPGQRTRRAFRSMSQYPEASPVPGVMVFRVESPIIFANAGNIASMLRALVFGSDAASAEANAAVAATRAVVVDFSNVSYGDSGFVESFRDLIDSYKAAEVLLVFVNPNSTVLYKMELTGLLQQLNSQFGVEASWLFLTVSDAVDAVKSFEPPIKPRKLLPTTEEDAPDAEV